MSCGQRAAFHPEGAHAYTAAKSQSRCDIPDNTALKELEEHILNQGLTELPLFFAAEWQWVSIDDSVCLPLPTSSVSDLVRQYDLCVTGEGLTRLTYEPSLLNALLPHVPVFARVSPKQKVSFTSLRNFC